MTHNLTNKVRTLAVGMMALAFTDAATAQMRRNSSTVNCSRCHANAVATAQMSGGVGSLMHSVQHTGASSSGATAHTNGGAGSHPLTNGQLTNLAVRDAASKSNFDRFAAQGAAGNNYWGGLSNFYSHTTPYANTMYSYPGYSGGGYGGSYSGMSPTATPTNYGAAIESANSGELQDDIARQQANFQGAFQNFDLMERRLQLKKAAFDQAMYEKMNTPPTETVREELRLQRLTRARNTPPAGEISSGESLNELLTNIQRIQVRQAIVGKSIKVDADTLGRINVTTTGDLRGSNELFKPGAFSKWPLLLSGDNFAVDRKKVLAALGEAARGQAQGVVNEAATVEARKLVEAMKDKLFGGRFDVSFTDYVNAIAFLNKLTNTVDILAKQDAANFLNGTYAATGDTVSELVKHMISHGLKFAKASSGDEPHYSKVYQLIVAYEIDLSRQAEQEQAKQVRVPSK